MLNLARSLLISFHLLPQLLFRVSGEVEQQYEQNEIERWQYELGW